MKFVSCLFLLLSINLSLGQNVKPYLQAAKPTSIYINWKTDENGTNPRVAYGTSSGNLNNQTNGTTERLDPKDILYNSTYNYHSVKLTGLTPDTGYYYKVYSGTESSSEYYFRTPPTSNNKPDKFRFIILGDHQMLSYKGQPYDKYSELVQASKAKAEELYGTPIADKIDMVVNDGDQVNYGRLLHYEKLHFEKSRFITPNLPIITTVGNHENWGTYGIQAYFDHFYLDDNFGYQGINSGTERYYAYQNANVLFIVLDSEARGADVQKQKDWFNQVFTAGKNDSSVDWIISIAHRPYLAEQYSWDLYSDYKDIYLPILSTSDKHVLHITGHLHLYARGQFKNHNAYHIISGGTASPRYWGDSISEVDLEEVQKTWSNYVYQIVELDNLNDEFSLKAYSIGSYENARNNELVDEIKYKRGLAKPNKPRIINTITGSINLPITFKSSPFSTTTTQELNSVEYQVSSTNDFSVKKLNKYQHINNWYGPENGQKDVSKDIGLGATGVLEYKIPEGGLGNGTYYIRVRHRDHNLGWSEWSDPVSFEVGGSSNDSAALNIDKQEYTIGETINITFTNGPGNQGDWIGVYNQGATPGTDPAIVNEPANGNVNGVKSISLSTPGVYFVGFFENNGFKELTPRRTFYVGSTPVLSTDKSIYNEGENVVVSFTNQPKLTNDRISIYRAGKNPVTGEEIAQLGINSNANNLIFSGLPKGYYYAQYHVQGTDQTAGRKINFQIGTKITTIALEKTTFSKGEPINITFQNGPGLKLDYIGLFKQDGNPVGSGNLWTSKYFEGLSDGKTTITGKTYNQGAPNQLPDVGTYSVGMYTNDSYNRVSNEIIITVNTNPAIFSDKLIVNKGESFNIGFVNAPGNTQDWIGVYKASDTPGTQNATIFRHLNNSTIAPITAIKEGNLSLSLNDSGSYFVQLFAGGGSTELATRINIEVRETPVLQMNNNTTSLYTTDDAIVNITAGGLVNKGDWVGIYKQGDTPSAETLIKKIDVTQTNQSFNFGRVTEGRYFAVYHAKDSFTEIGNKVNFEIERNPTNMVSLPVRTGINTITPNATLDVMGTIRSFAKDKNGVLYECTSKTEGMMGYDTQTKTIRVCTNISGRYEWKEIQYK